MGGFSIGYGISVSPRLAAFDPDALAYFTTAGITDNTAKTQINDFVVGIKDLGLWSSMVSWPLRSSQNAGTGTTAYSLGGLGTYNGTLVNSPSWTTDGIDHTASSSQTTIFPIDLVSYGASGFTIICSAKPKTGTQNYSMIFGQEGGATNYANGMMRLGPSATSSFEANIKFSGGGVSLNNFTNIVNVWGMLGLSIGSSSCLLLYNSSVNSATPSGSYNSTNEGSDTLRFASRGPTTGSRVYADLIASFGSFFNLTLSQSQFNSIRSIYKTTLGDGLGLP